CPVIDTLLLFSSEYEDKVHLLSHWGFKAFKLFSESPMMIYGGNSPILDVLFLYILLDKLKYGGSSQAQDSVNKNKRFDFPDYEDSRDRGFVHRSLDLHILSFIMRIQYPKSYRLTFIFWHT
ncbi:hypothetical protein Tco_1553199, partial [Tanacetum coccineum]